MLVYVCVQVGEYMSIQEEKAARFHTRSTQLRVLRAWADWAAEEKVAGWHKERLAKEHNTVSVQGNRVLVMLRILNLWQNKTIHDNFHYLISILLLKK